MKNNLFWTILFLGISAVAGWNIYQNRMLKSTSQPVEQSNVLTDALYSQRTYELSFQGRILKWPKDMEVLGQEYAVDDEDAYQGYRLVMAISELSCDVCRDEQTQFALKLAAETDPRMLQIVVNSSNKLYARGYMRLNAIQHPVHYDPKRNFFYANRIGSTPVLFLVSPENDIIAAHFPLPEHPEASKPFHDFCRKFLGLQVDDQQSS